MYFQIELLLIVCSSILTKLVLIIKLTVETGRHWILDLAIEFLITDWLYGLTQKGFQIDSD